MTIVAVMNVLEAFKCLSTGAPPVEFSANNYSAALVEKAAYGIYADLNCCAGPAISIIGCGDNAIIKTGASNVS